MKSIPTPTLILFLILLSACADRQPGYPALIPTDDILAEPEQIPDPVAEAEIQKARADALRDRAEALRGPVIDPESRRRMVKANG